MLFALALRAEQVGPFSTATPESQGMSSAKLNAMKGNLAVRKTTGLLIIRNDKIVYEWYAEGNSAATKHFTASMAKAIVAGVGVGVALSDGRLALDDPASKYIAQWRNDPKKSKITFPVGVGPLPVTVARSCTTVPALTVSTTPPAAFSTDVVVDDGNFTNVV